MMTLESKNIKNGGAHHNNAANVGAATKEASMYPANTLYKRSNSHTDLKKSVAYLTLCKHDDNREGSCSTYFDHEKPQKQRGTEEEAAPGRGNNTSGGFFGWFSSGNKGDDKCEPDEYIVNALKRRSEESLLPDSIVTSALTLQENAKSNVLTALRQSHGDVSDSKFIAALNVLSSIYIGFGHDSSRKLYDEKEAKKTRSSSVGTSNPNDSNNQIFDIDGTWTTLSRPSFPDCLGTNKNDDFMYSLGRMSFEMFRPVGLKCSIQRIINEIKLVDNVHDENSDDDDENKVLLPTSIPRDMQRVLIQEEKDARNTKSKLRVYNIVIHFTIEPRTKRASTAAANSNQVPAPSNPIKAVMTNNGYMFPDPDNPNRFKVWFTGGELAPYNIIESSSKSDDVLPPTIKTSCSLSLHHCRFYNKSSRCMIHGDYVGNNHRHEKTTTTTPTPSTTAIPLEWEEIFGQEENWKRSIGEKTKMFAVKMLLGADIPEGMDDNGTMSYAVHRPIAGHVDVLYMDTDLRITRGNFGTIVVQGRRKHGIIDSKTERREEDEFQHNNILKPGQSHQIGNDTILTNKKEHQSPTALASSLLPTVTDDEDDDYCVGMDLDDDDSDDDDDDYENTPDDDIVSNERRSTPPHVLFAC